jgi:hypothetical protein
MMKLLQNFSPGELGRCLGRGAEEFFSPSRHPDGSTLIGWDKRWVIGDGVSYHRLSGSVEVVKPEDLSGPLPGNSVRLHQA